MAVALVAATVAGSGGLPGVAPAEAADANLSIQAAYPSRTFSPNGDGYDDEVLVQFCLEAGANVTATANDATGRRVRTFAQGVSFPGQCGNTVTWDGRDDGGTTVADGTYTLQLQAVNATGSPSTDSTEIGVDRRMPGVVVAPQPGATLSGTVTFEFRPTAGFTVQHVDFTLGGAPSGCDIPTLYQADADGVFRTSYDTAVSCGEGPRQLTAAVGFTDPQGGAGHSWASPAVPVTLDNPAPPTVNLVANGFQAFSPDGDGQDDAAGFAYCTADAVEGGDLIVTVRVLDAAGAVVRALGSETREPAPGCDFWWYSYFTFRDWDGLDDSGAPVPDGDYTIEVRAADPTGAAGVGTLDVAVDRRAPGAVVAPAPGAELAGEVGFEFAPTDGFAVDQVLFDLSGGAGSLSCQTPWVAADADGRFRASLDTSASCGEGARELRAYVSYVDAFDGRHTWLSPPVAVTLSNPAPPKVVVSPSGPRVFSPDGDGQDDQLSFVYCATDAVGGGDIGVTVRVLDATGAAVRTISDEPRPPAPACDWWLSSYFTWASWDGTTAGGAPAPDGEYTIEVRATDLTGAVEAQTLDVVLDRRAPGAIVAPAPDAALSGPSELVFDPTDGFDVSRVDFQLRTSSGFVSCEVQAEAGAGGQFRASLDTAAACGDGPRGLVARVQFTDAFGDGHSWESPVVLVTLDNPAPPVVELQAPGAQRFSPNGDGQDDVAGFMYCTADAVDGGDLDVTIRVLDSGGSAVRSLVEEVRPPAPTCASWWLPYFSFDQWDGLDDNGTAVPDGEYTLELRATDPTGQATVETIDLVVDRRAPGRVLTPQPGGTLSGVAAFEFEPTDGFTIEHVDFWFANTSAGVFNASPDGIWRTTYPVGQLPDGPTTLFWSARWTDEFGAQHSYGGQYEVAIDPTSIPLLVDVEPASGAAPLDVDLTVTASDPNSAPLQLAVDFGDGTDDHASTVTAPYEPVVVPHTYEEPGTYSAVVSVSNGQGGYSSVTVPITVSGSPNTPPVADVATSPTSGTAPLDVATTIEATDGDGDALTYSVDHGDGTAPVTGPLPLAAPVTHRYSAGGTYIVRTQVSDGQLTVSRTSRITVAPGEPLVANAGDDRAAVEGDTLRFDASASRPAAAITSYHWDFGDGATSADPAPEHAYDEAGTYEVTLTVGSGAATATDTATVVVTRPPPTPGLAVTVTSSGAPVPGADVLVIRPDGTRTSATTNSAGRTHLNGLPDGEVSVYAYASGHQPAVTLATLSGGSGSVDISLVSGDVGAAQLDADRLTYEEIIEAGIDPELAENQNIYRFEIRLFFVPVSPGGGSQDPPPIDVPVIAGEEGVFLLFLPGLGLLDCWLGCSFGWNEDTVVPQIHYVEDKPIVQWLVIPGRASFLKEFFDVSMVVQNLAPEGFTFEEGTATLDLPSGLSLAPTAEPQSTTVDVPAIPGGSSRTATWVVRGDVEGEYSLGASYTGVLEPLGKPVRLQATSANPLKVWGGTALDMTITVDSCAVRNGPYRIEIALENVSDAPVYNAEVELLHQRAGAPAAHARYTIAPPRIRKMAVIPAGQTALARFTVYPALGRDDIRELALVPSESFVRRTGGNVTIPTELAVRDLGSCEGRSSAFAQVHVSEVDVNENAPDTATVTWGVPEIDGGAEIESYEVLAARSFDDALVPTGFEPIAATGEREVTLRSDRDLDARYITIATHLDDGDTVYQHMLAEGPPKYVALGDSFSAGEGYPRFEAGTDVEGNICHRSMGSYSRQLSEHAELQGDFTPARFHACSGAIVDDYFAGGKNNGAEPAQQTRLNEFAERVTITMGGNDVGFSDFAAWCALSFKCGKSFLEQGAKWNVQGLLAELDAAWTTLECAGSVVDPTNTVKCNLMDEIREAFRTTLGDRSKSIDHVEGGRGRESVLEGRLVRMYDDMLRRAPNASILVGNYPDIVDDSPTRCGLKPGIPTVALGLSGTEKDIVQAFTNELNGEIADAVGAVGSARLRLADMAEEFSGLELCDANGLRTHPDSRGVNPILMKDEGCDDFDQSAIVRSACSLHPNKHGQGAYYQAFRNELGHTSGTHTTVRRNEGSAAGIVTVAEGQRLAVESSWSDGSVGLTLQAPSGQSYTRGSAPEGATWTLQGSTETVVLQGAAPGQWSLSVEGLDEASEGVWASVFASAVTPPPGEPEAAATVEVIDEATRTVSVDASASSSPNGQITEYRWYFDDGTSEVGPQLVHTYAAPGSYAIGLLVTDAAGQTATTQLDPVEFGGTRPVAEDDGYGTAEDTALVVGAPGVLGNDTDGDGDELSAELGTEPEHGSVELAAGGGFTYTPEADFSGTDTFTYTAKDGTSESEEATVTVAVTGVNDAPAAVDDELEAVEDEELVVEAPGVLGNDTDVEDDELTAVLVAPPQHGTVVLAADGGLAYTPAAGYHGPDEFTYAANDGAASSESATVAVEVAAVNDPPAASPDAYGGVAGHPLVVAAPGVLGNDTDADGDPLTASLADGPAHGAVDLQPDGSFTYIPEVGFAGADSFTYTAGDGTATSDAVTVALTVDAEPNQAPAAAADSAAVPMGETLEVAAPGVLSNDIDPDGDELSAVLATAPTQGTLALDPDGAYSYTPAAGFHGTDTFTYSAHDGVAASAPATVTITVTEVNGAPTGSADAYTGPQDAPLAVAAPGVLGNDSDPDGDALTAALGDGPAHGTVDLEPDGSFAYAPEAGFHGTDTFTYTAGDGADASDPVTVTLTITRVNRAPVASGEAYATRQGEVLIVRAPGVLGNDTDPDGDALAAALVTGPAHGTLELDDDGSFLYTPEAGYSGPDAFTYKVNDGSLDSAAATVDLQVLGTTSRTLSVSDAAPVAEPAAGSAAYAEFVVSLSSPATTTVTVQATTANGTAVAGSDYRATTTEVRLRPGTTSKVVQVPILRDAVAEGEEQFSLVLGQASGASIRDGSGTATVLGEGSPQGLSVSDPAPVAEPRSGETAYVEFVVSLSSPATSAVTVRAETADGTATAGSDYRAAGVNVRIPRGTTSQVVKVRVLPDSVAEPEEHFSLVLSQAAGVTIRDGSGTGSIAADGAGPALSVSDADPVAEPRRGGTVYAEFTVSLPAPAAAPVTVHVATADGTAAAGSDYRAAGTDVRIPAGARSKLVKVLLLPTAEAEGEEQFSLVLTQAVGASIGDGTGTATIVADGSPPALSVSDAGPVSEPGRGANTYADFVVSLSSPATAAVTVRATTVDGTATAGSGDYRATAVDVRIPRGSTSKVVRVKLPADTAVEGDEQFSLVLSEANGAPIRDGSGVATIVDLS